VFAELVDLDNVRVLQPGQGRRLGPQAGGIVAVAAGLDHFERDLAPQR
jgi:hypothetical protein